MESYTATIIYIEQHGTDSYGFDFGVTTPAEVLSYSKNFKQLKNACNWVKEEVESTIRFSNPIDYISAIRGEIQVNTGKTFVYKANENKPLLGELKWQNLMNQN